MVKVLSIVNLPGHVLERAAKEFPEVCFYDGFNSKNYADFLPEVDVIFGNVPVQLLTQARKLKWIQIVSSGIDEYTSVDPKKIVLTTAKGAHWKPIAEYLVFTMLYFVKHYALFREDQRRKKWNRKPDALRLLKGQNVGIIGFGGIARTLADHLMPFEVNISAVTLQPQTALYRGVAVSAMEETDELIENSDHLVLSLPLTEKSSGILSEEKLNHVKRGAFIYNVSRGALINEKALINGIRAGRIGGAALDVFEEEPLPADSPLWEMNNVIVTPHISGHYAGLREDIFLLFKENLSRFLKGAQMKNVADFDKGY